MSPALGKLQSLKRSLTTKGGRSKPTPPPRSNTPPATTSNVPYVNPNPSSTFVNTLRIISLEAGRRQYGDLYDTFFYQDKKCRDRAIFLACRLRQNYDVLFEWNSYHQYKDDFTVAVCSRFYAYNYIMYAVDQQSPIRSRFLSNLDEQRRRLGVSEPAGREAVFAVAQVLQNLFGCIDMDVVERARQALAKCLESESKLSHDERTSMYVFHSMMSGMKWDTRDLYVIVEEDPMITKEILQVRESLLERPEPYQNPFEDASAIVQEDDITHHKKVDSGFYESITYRK
ncbi:hypothetical protein BGW37DRAFT_137832 [Umbelopsis sp. PMI_123]|nr:hypothetical protein BGW37DRAFT_137832 [Umbelopsis sp. PMI_123]